ncbi:MAG TPA: hypothetical protein VNX65_04190, partial [Patescibacteria group bacterium]|nr:hypothetical protein [Patescibacteria group bacterium]
QWKMVEKRAGSRNNAVLNAITAYTAYLNTGSHPNADLLESGEQILMPPQEVTSKIEAAVTNPESTDPVLVKYIVTLNNQSSYTSEEARKVLKLINSYFV